MNKIFLWGPSGSGKTWLLRSFIRKVNLLRTVFRKEDSAYDLWVEDETGAELEVTDLIREPTTKTEYQSIAYHRTVAQLEFGEDLFMNRHSIGMLDGPGDETTGQIERDQNTPENRGKVEQARAALKDADYLFVVVHPGKWALVNPNEANTTLDSDKAGEHFLDRLNALLKIKRNSTQRVMLCFTQSDKYGAGLGGLSAALAYLFGPRGKEIDIKLRKLYPASTRLEPPIHYMSATGYFNDPTKNGKRVSNYDASSFSLLDETKWNPHKVLDPFFDVFDKVQEEQLSGFPGPISRFPLILSRILIGDRLGLYKKLSNKTMLEEGEKKIFDWFR